MSYDPTLKCNTDIFRIFNPIKINDEFIITLFDSDDIERDSKFYFINSCGFGVKKYLPGAAVSSEFEAKSRILDFISRHLAMHAICYTIRFIKSKEPVGYILINSPISDYNLNEWIIDFWVSSNYQGFGIMSKSIPQLCKYLAKMNINVLLSQVNRTNTIAIGLLKKLQFTDISDSFLKLDNNQLLFGVRLS